jgi:DNA mismatch repair protein MutL
LHKTYLVCEGPGELVLVDQHAAHERVAFQRLRRAHGQRAVPRQRLLFPLRVEIGEVATAALRSGEYAATLSGLGFDVEPFGATELVVRAVPEPLREADPKPLLLDVLGQLGDDGRASALEAKLDEVLATMACHSVVRAGDVLTAEQALALLGELDDMDLRSHCPHGRPVLLRLPTTELERRFGRS